MVTDSIERHAAISDLLEEVGAKNHVRIVKFEAVKQNGRVRHFEVADAIAEVAAMPPSLVRQDQLRMLAGKKPIYLHEALRRVGGELMSVTANLRTNVGIDYCANALGSTAQPSQADYVGLSNNTLAVAATDTAATLPWSAAQATDVAAGTGTGEYTALGMARKQFSYAHTVGVASYTLSQTWTAGGTVTALTKAGLFGGSTKATQGSSAVTNILFLVNTFTSTSLANLDQLSLTWTVTI
jgi:hypothetical protein